MKICAIRLENVRRFTDPVEITGIGPGLNVLAAANEQGKSTIFDALHAVFFKDAKSWDKEIRALAPRAGGEPLVEVELDVDGLRYRLAKQFRKGSGKGEVRIWKGEQLFLQSDAAEAWLQELIKSPKDGGPAGLLWVRQGLTDFSDAKETLAARQDLMSSVAGEVDTVTGGQRMDAIRRDVRQALDRLVTSRGAKKGGALDAAEKAVSDLEAREAQLAGRVRQLRGHLDQRNAARAELSELQDPEAQRELEARLASAETELARAQRHQEKLRAAEQSLHNAKLLVENSEGQLNVLKAQLQDLQDAQQACIETAERLQQVQMTLDPARQALKEAKNHYLQAQERAKAAEQKLAQMHQAERLARAAEQRKKIGQQLAQAKVLQQKITDLKTPAARLPDDDMMDRIEQANAALVLADQAQKLAAAAVTVHYEEGQKGQVFLAEAPLPEGKRISLPDGGQLMVPGVARIELHPGQSGGRDQRQKAQEAFASALQRAEVADLDQARSWYRQRQDALRDLREAEVQLQIIAPEGIALLIQQSEALGAGDQAQSDPPNPAEIALAQADQAEAREAFDLALADRETAQAHEAAQQQRFEAANAHHQAALQTVQRAQAGLKGQADPEAALAHLQLRLQQQSGEVDAAQTQLDLLQSKAPDLEVAQARAQRARSVQRASRDRVQELIRDLAVLDSQISATAGDAVEEELAEVSDQLLAARGVLKAVTFEVATLRRLDAALEQARGAAQEAYVGPVLKELQPLLRLLWPAARLGVDAGLVLPDHLQRSGEEEAFDSLSGGTQEQIALLVRLAFARLLARSGRAAPIILDDAIVYTDDARIEKIFDALTMQSDELQILVFTCRQKSFRSLGGNQISIRPAMPAA